MPPWHLEISIRLLNMALMYEPPAAKMLAGGSIPEQDDVFYIPENLSVLQV
jgi:hypothetical protein